MKQIVAIYDRDIAYANRLAQYLGEVKKMPFQMVCFTKEEALLNFVKGQPISILIINEQVITEAIQKLSIKIQIVLLEESHDMAKELEVGVGSLEKCNVYKYQSVDVIAQKLSSYVDAKRKKGEQMENLWNRTVRVIGVYSILDEGNSFSIALAQTLARKEKVFYCDFGSFSCIDLLLGVEVETDLSDAIYYMHQGNLREQLASVIQSYGNMEYIAPVRCPEDLRVFSAEDMIQLLQEIIKSRRCETMVLSLAECMYMPIELLSFCHVIYMPMKKGLECDKKQKKLLQYLENNGKRSICERLHFITLPICKEVRAGVPYVEQLLWSEMGDFVRSLL